MLKLNPSPQFIAPVSLTIAGESETGSVLLTFKHQGKQALAAWLDSATSGTSGTSDLDLVAGVVLGWDGVNDESGAPVPFSRDALAALLDAYSAAAGEIVSAYIHALTESRAKN